MGEVRAQVTLRNEGDVLLFELGRLARSKIRTEKISALVDTGAVMMLLPPDLVKRLGLRRLDKRIAELANAERVLLDRAGTVSLAIGGLEMKTDCLVGPPGCQPLIGQLVLEHLALMVDPKRRALVAGPCQRL